MSSECTSCPGYISENFTLKLYFQRLLSPFFSHTERQNDIGVFKLTETGTICPNGAAGALCKLRPAAASPSA